MKNKRINKTYVYLNKQTNKHTNPIKFKTMNRNTQQELKSIIIDAINDNRLNDKPVNEIHNEVFNTDYFIIGRFDAEQWLINNGGIFNAIEIIKDYELDNFGTVNTDFSEAEHVCNMYTYILGEELINGLNVIQDNWDNDLNEELKAELLDELNG